MYRYFYISYAYKDPEKEGFGSVWFNWKSDDQEERAKHPSMIAIKDAIVDNTETELTRSRIVILSIQEMSKEDFEDLTEEVE